MSHAYEKAALRILDWLHFAERDLVGKTAGTFSGEAGVITALELDAHHGLCFTFDPDPHLVFRPNRDAVRWYPVSTIKHREV